MAPELQTAIVTGIFTLVAALGAVITTQYFAQKSQLTLEHEATLRSLRTAQLDRMRGLFKLILNAALEYKSFVHSLDVIWEGDNEKTRNQRINQNLSEALRPLNDAFVALTLEDVSGDVESTFRAIRNAAMSYAGKLRDNRDYHTPGYTPFPSVKDEQRNVDGLVDKLIEVMKTQLRQLQRP